MVDSVNSATGTMANVASTKDSKALNDEYQNFLKMLTTQLQNQDPTSPLDSAQFTQQIVAFSEVEQSIKTNKNLESILEATEGTKLDKASGYVDKIVEVEGNNIVLKNGSGRFAYNVSDTATSTTINISDSTGRVIYTTTGEKAAGNHDFTWDGKDREGKVLEDGKYKVSVIAKDANGKDITTTTYTVGQVKSVQTDGDTLKLALDGDLVVDIDKVKGVKSAATNDNVIEEEPDSLTGNAKGAQVANAAAFVGKTIEGQATGINLKNSEGKINYYLGADAAKVTVNVKNAKGDVVAVLQSDGLTKGRHEFSWQGLGTDGTTQPDGLYTAEIVAKDGAGKDVAFAQTITGVVSEVDVVGDKTILYVDGTPIPLEYIKSIKS